MQRNRPCRYSRARLSKWAAQPSVAPSGFSRSEISRGETAAGIQQRPPWTEGQRLLVLAVRDFGVYGLWQISGIGCAQMSPSPGRKYVDYRSSSSSFRTLDPPVPGSSPGALTRIPRGCAGVGTRREVAPGSHSSESRGSTLLPWLPRPPSAGSLRSSSPTSSASRESRRFVHAIPLARGPRVVYQGMSQLPGAVPLDRDFAVFEFDRSAVHPA